MQISVKCAMVSARQYSSKDHHVAQEKGPLQQTGGESECAKQSQASWLMILIACNFKSTSALAPILLDNFLSL